MNDVKQYSSFMLEWITKLAKSQEHDFGDQLREVQAFWSGDETAGLAQVREFLWSWVDQNGGPRLSSDSRMLLARMILCASYEDNLELRSTGFFEDLLLLSGVSRDEINAAKVPGTE